MSEIITKEQIPEYEAFLQAHPKGHFAQSVLWAKQKPMWKWEAIVSRDANGTIKGSLAVLIRKIVPGLPFTMMYGCRGPVTALDDKETMADLIDGAKKLAKQLAWELEELMKEYGQIWLRRNRLDGLWDSMENMRRLLREYQELTQV